MRRSGRTHCGSASVCGGPPSGRGTRGGVYGRGGWWKAVVTVVVAGWGMVWLNLGNVDGADTCGGKLAGSWGVTALTVFPATLVMPGHQLFKWEFKSDGPLGGDAFLHGGERRRYSCQGNSYTLDNYFGITLTLSPEGRRLDGECRDLVSAAGGGCRIHAVRKSGPPSVGPATAQSTPRSPQLPTTTAPTSPIPPATSSLDSRDAPASYAKGNSFFAANRYDLAEQSYSVAIAVTPDAPHYLSRGHARLALLKYNEAWEDYNRAIELRPDYAPSYLARGTLYWLLGRNLLAEDDLRAAIRLEPDNDFYYERLAVILREGEKKQEITDTYWDAFIKDPTRPWALEGWLGGLWEQKKYDEILRIYFEYKDRKVYTGWLYYYAAQVFKERSNQQSAREMFLHAILHNDSDELLPIETYSAIAELERDMGLRQECLSHRSQYQRRMGRPDDGRQWCYERK